MADRPFVATAPGVRFGQPHVKGVPVEAITGMLLAGESLEVVADEYDLSRADVLVACWYLGTYGTRRWRRLWGTWADDVHGHLAASYPDYATVPDPPLDA